MTTLTFEQYLEIMYDETSIKKLGKLVYKHLQGQHDQQTHDPTGGLSKYAFNPPPLPAELRSGTVGQSQVRLAERAKIMEATYGVKFSLSGSNPLGVAEGKKLGQPGIGLPRAIYDSSVDVVTDSDIIKTVTEAGKKWGGSSGYVTYTTLKFATGLSFQQVFGVVKNLKSTDPYAVNFSVDRQGKNAQVKFVAKSLPGEHNQQTKLVYKGSSTSGNFGHAGIIGHQGGSAPSGVITKKKWEDLSTKHFFLTNSRAALILANGDMVDMNGLDHIDYLRQTEHPEIFTDMRGNSAFNANRRTLLAAIFHKDVLRVREMSSGFMSIQSSELNTETLRRIQRLHDAGKLRFTPGKNIHWEGFDAHNTNDNTFIDTTYEEIMSAERVVDGVLKELATAKLVYKGGEGSGFEDHKGRPGEVGGSVARDTVLTDAQMMAWYNNINIALYDKFKAEHGSLVLDAMYSVAWTGGMTEEQFVSRFNETVEPPDIQPVQEYKSDKENFENVMWAIKKYVQQNRGATAVEIPTLAKLAGTSTRYIEYAYDKQFYKWFQAEYQANLFQWRLKGMDFRFDSRKGIVTKTQAMISAMKRAGYNTPADLYKLAMKYKPKIVG